MAAVPGYRAALAPLCADEPAASALFNAQEARGRFKKFAEDVMEPLMCLGFSSGIWFYQKTKVLEGLSAERNPGPV